MKNNFRNLVVIALLALAASSCQIGLGTAVDTQAPELEIKSPASDSVLRGDFAFTGTWSDDGDIKDFSIVLNPISNSNSPIEYKCTYDPKLVDWTCYINPLDTSKPVPDGTYEAIVSITDYALHVTKLSRLFTIDNTAPLIILQRPSSRSDTISSDWDSYGQSFSLSGQAADDNNVERIEINIYDDAECTNLLNTIVKTNVPPTISLDVASFVDGEDNDYAKIYGSTVKQGTKPLFCKIVAYDGSQHYPSDGSAQTEDDKKGNSSDSYYLYDEISANILDKYKVTEVYHMMNGTYSSPATNDIAADVARNITTINSVKSILKENIVSVGSFTLNPENNPTFQATGKNPLRKDGTDFTANEELFVSNGTSVVIEVSPGLDGISLDAESLKVYVYKCDDKGDPIPGVEKIYPVTTRTKSGSSYKFITQINPASSGLTIGDNYVFGVEGTDNKGNPVLPNGKGFGIHFAATGAAPALVVENPVNSITYLARGKSLQVNGYMSVDSGCPNISILNGTKVIYTKTFAESEGTAISDTKIQYNFDYTIPASEFEYKDSAGNQLSSDYSLTIKATNDGVSTIVNKSVMFDVDGPKIEIQSVAPMANLYEKDDAGKIKEEGVIVREDALNGTVSIKLGISDDFDNVDVTTNKPKYEFTQGEKSVNGIIDNPNRATLNIDTTKFSTGTATFKVTAWDRAGNKSESTTEYFIDQFTDFPVILPNDAASISFKYNSTAAVVEAAGKNMVVQGGQIGFKITDDDGIKNVKVYKLAVKNDTDDANDMSSITVPDVNKDQQTGSKDIVFTYNLPSVSGYNKLKVEVTDVNGAKTTVGPFNILVTASAPTLSSVVASPTYITTATTNTLPGAAKKFTNTLTIESDQAPFYIFRKTADATAWDVETGRHEATKFSTNSQFVTVVPKDGNKTSYEVVLDNIAPTETTNYYYIVLDTNYHESNTKNVTCVVDSDASTLKVTAVPGKDETKDGVTSFTFQGTASDGTGNSVSGVKDIRLTIATTTSTGEAISKTVTVTGTQNWAYALKYKDATTEDDLEDTKNSWAQIFAEEGDKTVTLRVSDNAGNYSDSFTVGSETTAVTSRTFVYDKKAPSISVNGFKEFMPDTGLSITGTIKESYELAATNPLIIKEEYSADGTNWTVRNDNVNLTWTGDYKAAAGASLAFKLPLKSNGDGTFDFTSADTTTDGTYRYTLFLTDKAGNVVEVNPVNATFDKTEPTLTIDTPKAYTNTTFYEFTGTAADDNFESATAELQVNNGGTWTNVPDKSSNINPKSDGKWAWKVYDLEDKQYRVHMVVKDKAGNSKSAESSGVTVDTTPPETTITGNKFYSATGVVLADGTTLTPNSDTVYYAKEVASGAAYEIEGTITEANYKNIWISGGKKNNINLQAGDIPNITVTGNTWKIAPTLASDGSKDGSYKLTLSIEDLAGNRTDEVINIDYDTQAPSITITKPTDGQIFTEDKFDAAGSVLDAGIGLAKLEYTLDNGTTWVEIKDEDGHSIEKEATSWNKSDFESSVEGKIKLKLRITDLLGHEKVSDERAFYYDKELPKLLNLELGGSDVVTDSTSGAKYTKTGTIVITGKAYDTNLLKSIVIEDSSSGTKYTLASDEQDEITKDDDSGTPIAVTEIAAAKSAETAIEWKTVINVGGENDGLSNGLHTFKVTVTDDAGQKQYGLDASQVDTVKVTVDKAPPTIKLNSLPNNTNTRADSYLFTGKSGDQETSVSFVKLKISNSTDSKSAEVTVDGIDPWSYELNYQSATWAEVFADEGPKTVSLYAEDVAGNSKNKFKFGNETSERTSITFVYDKANPVLEVTENKDRGFMPENGFTFKGTASDSYSFDKLTVVEYFMEQSATTHQTEYSVTSACKSDSTVTPEVIEIDGENKWSCKVPLGTNAKAEKEGKYKYVFTAYDSVGNTTQFTKEGIVVDKTLPEGSVNDPVDTATGSNYIKSNQFTFTGTAKDANFDTAKVFLQKKDNGTWADVDGQTSEVIPDSSNGDIWNWKVYDLSDAEYRVRLEVKDKAGNQIGGSGSWVTSTGSLIVDTTDPQSTIKATGFVKEDGTALENTTDISAETETTFYAKEVSSGSAFTINGTITEQNFDATLVTLETRKGGIVLVNTNATYPTFTVNASEKTWAITAPTGITDDVYKYTITIKDKAGNRADYVVNLRYDSTDPSIAITTPVNGDFFDDSTVSASGTVRDTGIGLAELKYSLDGGTTWSDYEDSDGNTIGKNASSWAMDISFTEASVTTEGAKYLKLKTKDLLGHEATTDVVRFSYDSAKPVITLADLAGDNVSTDKKYINGGNLAITGTAYDTNLLKSIVIEDDASTLKYTLNTSTLTEIKKNDAGETAFTAANITAAKSDSTKLSWKKTIASSALSQGAHTFTVTVIDDAGRTDKLSKSITVDTVKPTVTLESLPDNNDCLANSFTFRGEATDATSGVAKVELTISNGTTSQTVTATGKEIWYCTVTYDDNTWKEVFADEGVKTVTVKVTDKAGLAETNFTYADDATTSASKTFVYDSHNPVLTVTASSVLEFMPTGGFTIKGTASDTYKLFGSTEGTKAIVVTEKHSTTENGTYTATSASGKEVNVTDITAHSGKFEVSVPLSGSAPVEGYYRYTFTLKDSQENTSTYDINKVTVDLTAPYITIGTPATDTTKTGTNAINETSFRFDGTLVEANAVAAVYYKVIAKGGTAPTPPSTDVLEDSTWTTAGWKQATAGQTTWSAFQTFKSGSTSGDSLGEGEQYKLYAYAVDKAGNVGNIASSTDSTKKAIREFDVDMSVPSITTKIDDEEYNVNTTAIKTAGYTFKFKASDTYALAKVSNVNDITVTIKKDDKPLASSAYTYGKDDGYNTVTIANQADGLYEYTISATDKVGKTTTITRNIRKDTNAPVLSVLSPDLTAYQKSTSVTVRGSSEDDSGTKAIWYAYGVDEKPTIPTENKTDDASWTDNNWTKATGTTSWKIENLTGVEGTPKKLFIVAVDNNGLVRDNNDDENYEVKVDLSNPHSSTEEGSLITNTSFTLTGTVWDENGIAKVEISDGVQTTADDVTPTDAEDAISESSKVTWTKTYTVTTARNGATTDTYASELADGTYSFVITTTDSAGKTTTKNREIKVDTTKPTLTSASLAWNDTPITGGVHTDKNPTLNIVAADTNLESVSYYINDGSSTTVTSTATVPENQWNMVTGTIANGTGTYSRPITFDDGEGYVYIRVVDKAGNTIYSSSTTYAVDTTNPGAPTLGQVDGEDLNGTKLINGEANVTFKVTAYDQNDIYTLSNGAKVKIGPDATKIASVNLSKVGTTDYTPTTAAAGKGTATTATGGAKTGEWTVIVPKADFTGLSGDTPIYVKVTDVSGNAAEYKMFSVDLDTTKPETTITNPVPGTATNTTVINGKVDVTGSVKEDNPKSVALYYRTTEPGTSDNSSTTTAGWTLFKKYEKAASASVSSDGKTVYTTSVSDITKFTFADVDFNSISGASSATTKNHDIWLLVYAQDTAGNPSVVSSSVYKKYNVDLEADRPVIKFSNLALGTTMASNARTGFENSELYGSVTDDDGVPETVQYFIGTTCPAANATTWLSSTGNDNFTYSNGSFTLKFLTAAGKADDGEKTIFFKVTDKEGKTFLSSTGTTYNVDSLIITDGTDTYGSRGSSGVKTASTVYLKVDTQAPAVYTEAYYIGNTASTKETDWSSAISAETFGGTQAKFFLYEYAYDANEVTSLKFRIPVATGDSTSVTPVNGYYEYSFTKQTDKKTSNDIEYTKWLSGQINVAGFVSGTRSCEFVASDGIKAKTTPVNVSIDNTPPTVTVESHKVDEQVRSSFALKGNFEEGDANTTLKYIISTSATEPTATQWASATNVEGVSSMNWRIYFDNDNESGVTVADGDTHDKQPKYNIVDLMSSTLKLNDENQVVNKTTNEKYTSLVRLYYHFMATDAYGNSATSSFSLKIDPQGDIPVILMSYPEVDKDANGHKKYGWYCDAANTPVAVQWFYTDEPGESFGATRIENVTYLDGEDTKSGTFTYKYRGPTALLSGIIRTIGTAEDDKTLSGLYMQIDPNYNPAGDGKFASNWASKACPKDLGTAYSSLAQCYTIVNFANNTKQGISLGSRTSWNLAINKNGEFNGSIQDANGDIKPANNYIAIRLYAVDVDNNISATDDNDFFIITIDSGAPKIGSTKQLYIYQYRWVSAAGGVIYTNVQTPVANSPYFTDSGCRTAGTENSGKITSVAADNKSVTVGSTTYSKDFNINEYIDGMWLKGEWWLSGSVEDENGIQSAEMSVDGGTGASIITGTGNNYNYSTASYIATTGSDYLINYRVGSTSANNFGSITYTLTVLDTEGNPTTKDFIICYDNKAPTVAANAADGFAISTDVINDNGSYKVESAATELSGESGFDKVVFYFKRTLSGYKYVYDAYMQKNQATNKWRYEVESSGQTANVVYDEDTGLYWKPYTVDESGVSGRDLLLTVDNIDSSVHKGTLAKIGGVIYTVTNVSGAIITLDGAPSSDLAGTTVYFVVGHVVDHVGTEGQGSTKQSVKTAYGYGYYSSADDDGDMMVEKVLTVGTKTTWSGNINSQNIPDGPIEIHYVVFDKAGNSKHEVVTGAFVKNNAPRLASLRVWTDYNGNGVEDPVESDTKYYNSRERKLNINGTEKTVSRSYGVTDNLVVSGNDLGYDDANATAFKRVTDLTRFYPEVVGGNGHLYYSYKIGTGTDPAGWTKATGKSPKDTSNNYVPFTSSTTRVEAETSAYMKTDLNGESYVEGSSTDKIELPASVLTTVGNSPANAPTWFEYTIWDSTPGTTLFATNGSGGLTAKFTVALKVAIEDTVAPKAVISPFFWKGNGYAIVQNEDNTTTETPLNSLYLASKENGHIELESDLTGTLAATIYGDTDPKVSGKITIRGTAYDDIRLSQLWVKFDGITLTNALVGTNPDSTNHAGYVLAATYNKSTGIWTSASAIMDEIPEHGDVPKVDADNWTFAAKDVYCTADGHKAEWEFSINTAAHSSVSERNVKAYIMAVSERGEGVATYSSATDSGTDPKKDAVYNKPSYQMDIVPYVKAIHTTERAYSGLKDNNIRSASGKYSIIKGNKDNFITVEGFNLAPNTTKDATSVRLFTEALKDASDSTALKGINLNISDVSEDKTIFYISNEFSNSGYLEVFVNGNRAMNNINKNDAHGSYEFTGGTKKSPKVQTSDYQYMPNREADYITTKNVTLTDDRYFRLFNMQDTGSSTENGYYPTMIMNGNNPVFSYLNKNGGPGGTVDKGGSLASDAWVQRAEFKGSDASNVYTEYLVAGISWDQMAMAKDDGGRYYHMSSYTFTGACLTMIYDRFLELCQNGYGWGAGTGYSGYNGNFVSELNNNGINLESNSYGNTTSIERYQYPKIVTKGNSKTGTAVVYVAYYDAVKKDICFRNFQLGTSVSGDSYNLDTTNKDLSNTTYSQMINFVENGGKRTYQNGGGYTSKHSTTYGTGRLIAASKASKDFAIGVTSEGFVVIVYYDGAAACLKMRCSKSAVTGDSPTSTIEWNDLEISFPSYVGSYVSMVIDSHDGVHIAAFDARDSDLSYIYIPDITKTNMTHYTVDQFGAVGNWTQIKIDSEGHPVIAYTNATENGQRDSIKLAIAEGKVTEENSKVINSVEAGVEENTKYTTGKWEYMTVPALSAPQGGDSKFQNVCLDFDANGIPVVGYLGTNLEFGKYLGE